MVEQEGERMVGVPNGVDGDMNQAYCHRLRNRKFS